MFPEMLKIFPKVTYFSLITCFYQVMKQKKKFKIEMKTEKII